MAYPEAKLGESGVTRRWNVQLTASSWSLLEAEFWWLSSGGCLLAWMPGPLLVRRGIEGFSVGKAGLQQGEDCRQVGSEFKQPLSPCSESVFPQGNRVFLLAQCLPVHPAQEQPLSHESWLSLKLTLYNTYLRSRAEELYLPGLHVQALPLTSFVTLGH